MYQLMQCRILWYPRVMRGTHDIVRRGLANFYDRSFEKYLQVPRQQITLNYLFSQRSESISTASLLASAQEVDFFIIIRK